MTDCPPRPRRAVYPAAAAAAAAAAAVRPASDAVAIDHFEKGRADRNNTVCN